MSFTYNISDNIGKVRSLIGDVVSASALLSDEEISAFLSMKSNDYFGAAALACRRIASSKALIAKRRTAGNFSEDTTGIYKAYLDMAKEYESVSQSVPAEAQSEEILTDFNYNEILQQRILRGESLDD